MSHDTASPADQTADPTGRWAAQRGQAVVEAAGSIMFLLLLIIGMVDFSPAVVRTAQLTQAVRDGAAFARTTPTNSVEVRKRVVKAAPSVFGSLTDAQIAALTNTQVAVTCTAGLTTVSKACSAAVVGDTVTVSATYNYQTRTGLFSALLAAPIVITRSATSEIF